MTTEHEAARVQQRIDARKTLESFERLQQSPDYQTFMEELKKQIEYRRDSVELIMPTGVDSLIQKAYTTGEVAALRTVVGWVDAKIEESKSVLAQLREERTQETANGPGRSEHLSNEFTDHGLSDDEW